MLHADRIEEAKTLLRCCELSDDCNHCPIRETCDGVQHIRNAREIIEYLQNENEKLCGLKDHHYVTFFPAVKDCLIYSQTIEDFDRMKSHIAEAAIKDFAKMLIDKAHNGVIQINDLPDYVLEYTKKENLHEQ